jgi:anti-anti-sigma regulatory factor
MADSAAGKVVSLPAIVDLDALDVVRDGLIDAVELGNTEIDASKVERVATNALFMLISASETSRRNSFSFAITGTSAPMLAAIDRLGLSDSFTGLMKG